MSKDKKLLQELSPLFKDKAFVKALGEAKTSEAIKDVFKSFNKESLFSKLSPEFAETLAKTGNTKKIVDTMNYVEKYESLGKVMKILQNPTMKYASRIFARVAGVAGFALGAFSAYSKFNEASEIAMTNQERAEVKKADALFETGYAIAGGIEALGVFGALAGIQGVCAFVPGIGWVVGGVLLGASYFVKEVVFETLDKYNKNYKDLLGHAPLLIKQHILTSILGSDKTDVAFGDWLVGSFKDLSHLTKKTGSEGIKALLYTDEWKRNPLAMVDISNTEMMAKLATENPPVTREQVAKAIDDVEQRVAQRYAYLKVKCGTYREGSSEYIDVKKAIPTNNIAGQRGMWALDQLMIESQYSVDNPQMFGTPNQLALKKQTLKTRLDKNPTLTKKLDTLWASDPKTLMYMYRYANDFKSHVEQFGTQDPESAKLFANMAYFNDYMLFNSLARGTDISSQSQGFGEANFITCREFFLSYGLSKPLASAEIYGGISKMQTVLYRIATEVIGAHVPVNTMDDLKGVFSEANEKAYGLYFKGDDLNRLCVNGNYGTDAEYAGTNRDTLIKVRSDIAKKIQSNDLLDIGTGDKIFNKEIGNKYLAIIDQELKRI